MYVAIIKTVIQLTENGLKTINLKTMKTTISILVTAYLGLFLFTQKVNAQCTQCDNTFLPPGEYASEIGQNTTASGENSFAGGINTSAEGYTSFAFGHWTHALGHHSFALGVYAKSLIYGSFAIGEYCTTSANNTFVIGSGLDTVNVLNNNISKSLMIGFNSDKPTFFVGDSWGKGKTGRVGIGNATDPQAKLHIKGDENEDADIFLEPGTLKYARIKFGSLENRIDARGTLDLNFHTASDFVFWDGNVGIGSYNPRTKLQIKGGDIFIEDKFSGLILKSPDGQCWKGTVDNDGSFNFENVDCSLMTGKDDSQEASQKAARIYPNPAGNKVFVEIADGYNQAYVSVYNEQGVLLKSSDVHSGRNTIPLKNTPAGILIVKVYNDAGEMLSTEKIMHR